MKSWKVKEIVIMSVISIVFAIVYLVFTHFGNVLAGMFGPIAYEPIYGIWFIVSVIAAYIIRKPGAPLYLKSSRLSLNVCWEILQARWLS